MELQLVRRILLPLVKAGALAVANDVAAWEAQFFGRIVEVETYLGNTGTAAGPTTVDIKKNGTSIFSTVPSIAFNAAQKRRRDSATALLPVGAVGSSGVLTPTAGEPNGVDFAPGDYFRADVTGASTGVADLTVVLHIIAKDV